MTTSHWQNLLTACFLAIATGSAVAAGQHVDSAKVPPPDTSHWRCKFCPVETGWNGNIAVGIGHVSEGSFKFGEYNGLQDAGPYLLLNGAASYHGKDGRYWNIYANNLGLQSRSLEAEGGKQGSYKLTAGYAEIPHYLYNSGKTPYSGIGGTTLTLPSNWVPGATTQQMAQLNQNLKNVDIGDVRRIYKFGFEITPTSHWDYNVQFRRDTRTGKDLLGANFLTTSSLLPAPIDYQTDQIDAGIAYRTTDWQVKFYYYGSFLRDDKNFLVWTNPFTPLVPGGDKGRYVLAPDNSFHQLGVSGAWQMLSSTRIMANLAAGRGRQDDGFFPSTINALLNTAPLPNSSLDGEVNTINANIRIYSNPIDQLSLNAEYLYDERDNKTPQAAYQQVNTDVFVSGLRTNLPYGFQHGIFKLSADYRLFTDLRISAGGSRDFYNRTFQDFQHTNNDKLWGELRTSLFDFLDISLKYAHENREVSDFTPQPEIIPAENPLLRRFNLANRERNQARTTITFTPARYIAVTLTGGYAKDRYEKSVIGLNESRNFDYTADLAIVPTADVSMHTFYTREHISSDLSGSSNFSTPTWQAHEGDEIKTVGLGSQIRNVGTSGLDFGFDFSYSYSRAGIAVPVGTQQPLFPDLYTKLQSFKLYGKYRVTKRLALRLDYWYERYRSRDFALDNVTPNTVPNILTLGITSPNYLVQVIAVRAQYDF